MVKARKSSTKKGAKPKTPAKKPVVNDEENDEVESPSSPKSTPKGKSPGRGRPKGKSPGRGRPKSVDRKSKPTPAKKAKVESESEASDTEYDVERILEFRVRKGVREFQVKWKGWSAKEATWEPEEHLQCPELLEAFMKKVEKKNVSRGRRMSSRSSTKRASRLSVSRSREPKKDKVQEGRVSKRKTSVPNTATYSLRSGKKEDSGKVKIINGKTISQRQAELLRRARERFRKSSKGLKRVAVLAGGLTIAGAAFLCSNSAAFYWNNLTPYVTNLIHALRDKIY